MNQPGLARERPRERTEHSEAARTLFMYEWI